MSSFFAGVKSWLFGESTQVRRKGIQDRLTRAIGAAATALQDALMF
jgi:hypothetical protein